MAEWYVREGAGTGFEVGTTEWKHNVDLVYSTFSAQGWTQEAIAGLVAHMTSESNMNPWQWESDVGNTGLLQGYGLVQWTPVTTYIGSSASSLAGYAPFMGDGSIPKTDGDAQLQAIYMNLGDKYSAGSRRQMFMRRAYEEGRIPQATYEYAKSLTSMELFSKCPDVWACSFAWLYFYEVPKSTFPYPEETKWSSKEAWLTALDKRLARDESYVTSAYEYITGHEPLPPSPTPTGRRKGMPVWMMCKRII